MDLDGNGKQNKSARNVIISLLKHFIGAKKYNSNKYTSFIGQKYNTI